MSTTFPGALDDFQNPLPGDSRNNPSHASQHANANDAIEAIQAYLGVASSVSMTTITGRVVALEQGGGGVSPEEVQDIVGAMVVAGAGISVVYDDNTGKLTITATTLGTVTSVGASAPVTTTGGNAPTIGMPAASATVDGYLDNQDWARFDAKQPAGNYVTTDTQQTISGAKTFTAPIAVQDTGGVDIGYVDVVPDPNSSLGETMLVKSDAGVTIGGPYIVLDTFNMQTTMPGATQGDQLVVAAIDSFGVVSFGYATPPPPAYSVVDTNSVDVVIKATNVAPAPEVWVDLGLSVTVTEDIVAGTGNLLFDMILSNPTTRTGVVEYGLEVGGVMSPNTIQFQIPANYLQTTATTVSIAQGIAQGTVVALKARVLSNSNNQFSLAVDNTPVVSQFKIWAVGATSGGGGGGTVESVGGTAPITSSGGINPQIGIPKATVTVDGYLSKDDWSTFNGKQNPATTLAGYGITDAYTKTQSDANYPTKSGGGAYGTWSINIGGTAEVSKGLIAYNAPVNTIYWGWDVSGILTCQVDTTDFGGNVPILAKTLYQRTSTADLNDQKENGFYRVNNSVNSPVDPGSAFGQLFVSSNLDTTAQVYVDHFFGSMYYRAYSSSGGWQPWRTVLDSNNFNNFAPTLGGGGASGTWAININGVASTANQASQATPDIRFRSVNTRATNSWGDAQFEAYTNPASPAPFASMTFHVQDATNAPQVGFHGGSVNTVGFFDSTGDNLLFGRSFTDGIVRNADKMMVQSVLAGQNNFLWRGTQAEYDAITTKDPNTWYAII